MPITQSLPHPWADRPEFPVYLALKYQLCRQYASRGAPPTGTKLTARRVLNLLRGPSGDALDPDRLFTDLHAVSGHAIRERLKALNSGTVLSRTGRGLRNAVTYEWIEPFPYWTVKSYEALSQLVGPNIQYALDAYRVAEAFGSRPFQAKEFVRVLANRRERFLGRINKSDAGASTHVTNLLVRRLKALVAWGVLKQEASEFSLTPFGERTAHWLELFANSVDNAALPELPVEVRPQRQDLVPSAAHA